MVHWMVVAGQVGRKSPAKNLILCRSYGGRSREYDNRRRFCCSYNGYRFDLRWTASSCIRIYPADVWNVIAGETVFYLRGTCPRGGIYQRLHLGQPTVIEGANCNGHKGSEGSNAKFSDFCHRTVESLITADAFNITQDREYEFSDDELIWWRICFRQRSELSKNTANFITDTSRIDTLEAG